MLSCLVSTLVLSTVVTLVTLSTVVTLVTAKPRDNIQQTLSMSNEQLRFRGTAKMMSRCSLSHSSPPMAIADFTAEKLAPFANAKKACIKQSGEGHKGGVLFVQLGGELIVVKKNVGLHDLVALEIAELAKIPAPRIKILADNSDEVTAFLNVLKNAKYDGTTKKINENAWLSDGSRQGFVLVMEAVNGKSVASLGKVAKDCMRVAHKNGRNIEFQTSLVDFPAITSEEAAYKMCGAANDDELAIAKQLYQKKFLTTRNIKLLASIAAMDAVLMEWDQMTAVDDPAADKVKIGNMENVMYKQDRDGNFQAVAIDFAVASWNDAAIVQDPEGLEKNHCRPQDIAKAIRERFLANGGRHYRNKVSKMLEFPAVSTMEFKDLKETYSFFPMMDPLSDTQWKEFQTEFIAKLKDLTAAEMVTKVKSDIIKKLKEPAEAIKALTDFVAARMEALQPVASLPVVAEVIPASFLSHDFKSLAVKVAELKWGDDVAVSEDMVSFAVNKVLQKHRNAGQAAIKQNSEQAFMRALASATAWECLVCLPFGPPTRKNKFGHILRPEAWEKTAKACTVPQNADIATSKCTRIELKNSDHWCFKANAVYNKPPPPNWAKTLHGYATILDLKRIRVRASDRKTMDPGQKVCPASGMFKDSLFSTRAFSKTVGGLISINANYFVNAESVHSKKCARPYGLCMHGGSIQNPPNILGDEDPQDKMRQKHNLNAKGTVAVMFNNDKGLVTAVEKVATEDLNEGNLAGFQEGVAGNWLVRAGKPLSPLAMNPVPADSEARTAIGWVNDKSGHAKRLLVVVVEKRAHKKDTAQALMPDQDLGLGSSDSLTNVIVTHDAPAGSPTIQVEGKSVKYNPAELFKEGTYVYAGLDGTTIGQVLDSTRTELTIMGNTQIDVKKGDNLRRSMQLVNSGGISLVELGELMVALGATEAVNLDGGGSSNMCRKPMGMPSACSLPSDYHVYPTQVAMFRGLPEGTYKRGSRVQQAGVACKTQGQDLGQASPQTCTAVGVIVATATKSTDLRALVDNTYDGTFEINKPLHIDGKEVTGPSIILMDAKFDEGQKQVFKFRSSPCQLSFIMASSQDKGNYA